MVLAPRPLLAAALLATGLFAAAPARAVTVTLGPPTLDTSSNSSYVCPSGPCSSTFVQSSSGNPADLLHAPADGVVVAWAVAGAGGTGSIYLRVVRAAGGSQYTGAGKSDAASALDGSAMTTNLPIQFGDLVGVDVVGTLNTFPSPGVKFVSGGSVDLYNPALVDGTASSPTTSSAGTLQFNATVQLDAPVVSGVSPAGGATKGGESVTIDGDHLAGASQVLFGGTPSPSFSGSNSRITATVPAGMAGTVDVRVVAPGGPSAISAADRYTYTAPDTSPPAIGRFSVSPSAFVAANIGGSIATAVGARVSYTLSEAATTTFRVQRVLAGRRRGKTCRAPGRHPRGRRCTRYAAVRGSFTHADVSGPNSFRFTGRVGARRLKPAGYALVAVSADTAGNKSQAVRRRFRIVR
jgi:IPT/TIG domain